MKYIEELVNGNCFIFDEDVYLLTSDFKKNGQKLAYNMSNGTPRWMNSQTIVEATQIYTLDKENNIVPVVKEYAKVLPQNTNLS